jgi:hypothetical protein
MLKWKKLFFVSSSNALEVILWSSSLFLKSFNLPSVHFNFFSFLFFFTLILSSYPSRSSCFFFLILFLLLLTHLPHVLFLLLLLLLCSVLFNVPINKTICLVGLKVLVWWIFPCFRLSQKWIVVLYPAQSRWGTYRGCCSRRNGARTSVKTGS